MKEFFTKVWVQVTAWIMLILAAVVLIIGGVTGTDINTSLKLLSELFQLSAHWLH